MKFNWIEAFKGVGFVTVVVAACVGLAFLCTATERRYGLGPALSLMATVMLTFAFVLFGTAIK